MTYNDAHNNSSCKADFHVSEHQTNRVFSSIFIIVKGLNASVSVVKRVAIAFVVSTHAVEVAIAGTILKQVTFCIGQNEAR